MANHSRAFEVTIAGLGLLVTGLLGYGQLRLSREQAAQAIAQRVAEEKRAGDNVEVQVMTLVAPYLGHLTKTGPEFETSYRVVMLAAEYLSAQHGRTALASMAERLSEANGAIPEAVKARIQEATVPASATGGWFPVLASLPLHEEAKARAVANGKLRVVRAQRLSLDVHLLRTKISRHLVVVAGSPTDRAKAAALAAQMRAAGIAPDAYPQQDKEWTRVGTAPFP